jgi:hypothetical protein
VNLAPDDMNYPSATFDIEANPNMEDGLHLCCVRHQADLLVMGYH